MSAFGGMSKGERTSIKIRVHAGMAHDRSRNDEICAHVDIGDPAS